MRTNATHRRLFLFVLLCSLVFLLPVHADAAEKCRASASSSGTVTIRNGSGTSVASFTVDGKPSVGYEAVKNGSTIYFTTYKGYQGKNNYLYSYQTGSKAVKKLCKLPKGYFSFDVNDCYSGSLYLTGWNPSDNAVCYRYYLKTKKLKKLATSAYASRYGRYVILDDTFTMGAFFLYNLRVYDTSKQKLSTLTSKCGGWSRSGNTIYFAQKTGGNYSNYKYKIRSYSLSGKKYKTILSSFKAFTVDKITSTSIYYTTNGGSKCFRYTIKTKKKAALSFTAYAKAVGQ